MPYDNAVAVESPKGSTDTQITRNEIHALQDEIGKELSVLADALSPVLRQEPGCDSRKDAPNAACSTSVHGWLCLERNTLITHLQVLKSLNSRLEV